MNLFRIDCRDLSFAKSELVYLHNGKDIGSGAFDIEENAQIKIIIPRVIGAVSITVNVYDESFKEKSTILCRHSSSDLNADIYLFSPEKKVGLYFFDFEIVCSAGKVFGTKGKGRELVLSEQNTFNRFQYSVCKFIYDKPTALFGGIIYHVFVDRFSRGGAVPCRNDAVLIDEWEGATPDFPAYPGAHLENNNFYGGTIWGVIDKLDYLKSLGTTLIYLSPVFEAYSNHKYDTGNYMRVDEMFGSDEALEELIKKANSYGIGIILDGVFNHTGSDSIYFNSKGRYDSIGAYQSKKSPFYEWFDFQSYPDKYTCWWGIKILPRINPDIPRCREYFVGKDGVIDKYASLGIAGFRLDVADELSDDFICAIKARLSEKNPSSILYGEVWEDASNKISYERRKKYYLGSELDGVMNYPVRDGIIAFLRDKDSKALDYAFTEVMFNAPKRITDAQMNLLGTHDTERIITVLAGESADGYSNTELSEKKLSKSEKTLGVKLVKLAYTLVATIPGIPSVFYGDEVGLEGYKDPFNRRPYPWKNANLELRRHFAKIGAVRHSSNVYKEGCFKLCRLTDDTLIFERYDDRECFITVINNSDKLLSLRFRHEVTGLISGNTAKVIFVSPQSSDIVKTTVNNKNFRI